MQGINQNDERVLTNENNELNNDDDHNKSPEAGGSRKR
jgi:hypothetical protein